MTVACSICCFMFYVLIDPSHRSELPAPYVCRGCKEMNGGRR